MVFELKGSLFKEEYKVQLKSLFSAALNKRGYLKFELLEIKEQLAELTINESEAEIVYEYFIKDSGRFALINQVLVCGGQVTSDLDAEKPILTPNDAVNLMMAPYEIWLENGRADRAFLLCVVDERLREDITVREKSSSLHIDGKGGIGELKMSISENQRPLIERNKLFVLMDSDCKVPGELHPAARALKDTCELKNIHYHCLQRRMIENYLPTEYLVKELSNCLDLKTLLEKISVFNKLSFEQRSCFHFKKGFTNSANDQALYSDLSDGDRRLLNRGIGSDIARFYSDNALRIGISREIRKTESPKEAKEILKKIKLFMRVPA